MQIEIFQKFITWPNMGEFSDGWWNAQSWHKGHSSTKFGLCLMFLKAHTLGFQSATCRGQEGIPPLLPMYSVVIFGLPLSKHQRWPWLDIRHWMGWESAQRWLQVLNWLVLTSHAQDITDHYMWCCEGISTQVRLTVTLGIFLFFFASLCSVCGCRTLARIYLGVSHNRFPATAGALGIGAPQSLLFSPCDT